ncbi:MAG: DUF4832 domain-containing protein [Saprospiraceae bacterium]|nr:DUF4832 domain-containing protein [Saprospiraceae bacterium]
MIRSFPSQLLFAILLTLRLTVFGQPSVTVNYIPSTEDFANPERGFMQFTETSSGNYSPLDAIGLAYWRTLNQPFGADYSIYSTLGYRGFYLEDFISGPISSDYLAAMQLDFDAARQAGVKLVLRFAYTHKSTPPYGDAPKSIVLQHIAQLKPLFQANADIIALLNMGFIGAWGEGYYTDYFGDDSQPPYGLSAQNWNDRTEVLNALLDALPTDRSVQVRIPQMKQKAVYGADAPTDAAPLTAGEAFQNTAKARTGFHNDCFLSSFDDLGTFKNYDTGFSGSDTTAFKPYFAHDSQFVPVGGETCIDWDPYSDCVGQPGGGAQHEMARMHFSYLNAGWNNAVNNEWVSGGCIEEIKQRLGYRFELQTGAYPSEGRPGQTISVKIDLKNTGFAAPFNARKVRLLLRNVADGILWHVELPDDPRRWLPGNQIHTIEHAFCLPLDMPAGGYELLLHLADPYPALTNRPEYAIRMANQNTWEAATGINLLQHQISVNTTANNPACSGAETCFQPANLSIPAADFLASETSGCEALSVTFSTQTAFCQDYQWSFPGGTPATSTEANPTVLYQNPGVFDVSLAVVNATGTGSSVKTGYISVSAVPVPVIQPPGPISMVYGESILLDGGAGFASWLWNTGETTQQIIVSDCGAYSVEVVDNNGCSAAASEVVVSVSPVATFDNVVLISTPATSYQWLLNGIPIDGATSQTYIPTASGDYQVQVLCQGTGWINSNVVPVTMIIIGLSETPPGQIKIYPNPVSKQERKLILDLQGLERKPLTIILTDEAGRQIMQKKDAGWTEKTVLDLGETPAGTYFIQVWQEGKMVSTGMFLKR